MSRQKRQVGKGIEYLPRITEGRIEQRYVAHPDCGKTISVDVANPLGLPGQYRHVALVKAQWQKNPEGQLIGREHAPITAVAGKCGRRLACGLICSVHIYPLVQAPVARVGRAMPRCTAGLAPMRWYQALRCL